MTNTGWWHGTVARTSVLAGELSLSHAQPSADGWPLVWVNRPLEVSQQSQLSLSSSRGRSMSSELQLDARHLNRWRRYLVNAYEVKAGWCSLQVKLCDCIPCKALHKCSALLCLYFIMRREEVDLGHVSTMNIDESSRCVQKINVATGTLLLTKRGPETPKCPIVVCLLITLSPYS